MKPTRLTVLLAAFLAVTVNAHADPPVRGPIVINPPLGPDMEGFFAVLWNTMTGEIVYAPGSTSTLGSGPFPGRLASRKNAHGLLAEAFGIRVPTAHNDLGPFRGGGFWVSQRRGWFSWLTGRTRPRVSLDERTSFKSSLFNNPNQDIQRRSSLSVTTDLDDFIHPAARRRFAQDLSNALNEPIYSNNAQSNRALDQIEPAMEPIRRGPRAGQLTLAQGPGRWRPFVVPARRIGTELGINFGANLAGGSATYYLTGREDAANVGGFATAETVSMARQAIPLVRTGTFSLAAFGRSTLVGQGIATVVAGGLEIADLAGARPEWAGGDGWGKFGWSDEMDWRQRTASHDGWSVGSTFVTGLSNPLRSLWTEVVAINPFTAVYERIATERYQRQSLWNLVIDAMY
jgi:hypothetical protein